MIILLKKRAKYFFTELIYVFKHIHIRDFMFHKINLFFKQDRSNVMKGSIWTIAGFGSEMFVRMVSSLILTRIFLPEVFGLMALVTSIMVGMGMISDVGVRISLIQHPNGKTAKFAQTAWTVEIIKGFILWFIVFMLAESLSNHFQEPLLIELLQVAALTFIISGFRSSNISLYSRELGVAKIVLYKMFVQFISVSFVIIFSIIYKSIWVIIASALLSSLLDVLFGFILFKQFPMRFKLDLDVLKSVFKLGKWLVLATIFHYLISQGDRLILGGLIDKTELGLYNLAAMFAQIPISILGALSGNILMPFLARSFNDSPENFNQDFDALLNKILLYMLPLIAILAVLGNNLIQLLYPSDFHLAGQILQLLAIASLFQSLFFFLVAIRFVTCLPTLVC
jgi:O-antigen/teichoic acid export membrane protein